MRLSVCGCMWVYVGERVGAGRCGACVAFFVMPCCFLRRNLRGGGCHPRVSCVCVDVVWCVGMCVGVFVVCVSGVCVV